MRIYNYIFETDPRRIYFINSSSDAYTTTLLLNITLFSFLKLLQFIFQMLRNKSIIFHTIYYQIKDETAWWTLIVSIIEVNMVNLAFNCGVQLSIPSFFETFNKINFVFMVMVLFILFNYAIGFYIIVAKNVTIRVAGILLQRCKTSLIKSHQF